MSGNNFYLGSTASIEGNDPTFNGTPGGLSGNEYFSLAGGDGFHEAVDMTFATSWIENNGKFTIGAVVKLPSSIGVEWVPIFGTLRITNAGGDNRTMKGLMFQVNGASQNTPPAASSGGLRLQATVYNGTTAFGFGTEIFDAQMTLDAGRLGLWNFFAVALDETLGANGCTLQINSTRQKFTSTYSSPATGDAGIGYYLGATIHRVSPNFVYAPAGTAFGPLFGASRRWADSELDAIYDAIRLNRPEFSLPAP